MGHWRKARELGFGDEPAFIDKAGLDALEQHLFLQPRPGGESKMHEVSLINELMERMQNLAENEGASRITHVNVRLGALSQMSAEHFRRKFIKSSKSTMAEGATLVIELSNDVNDPNAQELLLRSVELEL